MPYTDNIGIDVGRRYVVCPTHRHGGCTCCREVRSLGELRAMSDVQLTELFVNNEHVSPLVELLAQRLQARCPYVFRKEKAMSSEPSHNGPRVAEEQLDELIEEEMYHLFPGTTLTVCCLRLKNGFTVTGESACVSPDNFDEDYGRKLARVQARDKIWALEGYLLAQRLHDGSSPRPEPEEVDALVDDLTG